MRSEMKFCSGLSKQPESSSTFVKGWPGISIVFTSVTQMTREREREGKNREIDRDRVTDRVRLGVCV